MAEEVPLKEHIESLFRALTERLDTYSQSHREEHAQMGEQVKRDAATVNVRLEGMNELRTQINTERGQFATRDLLDVRVQGVNERFEEMARGFSARFDELANRIAEAERAKANLDGRMAMIGLMLLGASVVINILIGAVSRIIGH